MQVTLSRLFLPMFNLFEDQGVISSNYLKFIQAIFYIAFLDFHSPNIYHHYIYDVSYLFM